MRIETEDLIDSHGVAEILQLSSPRAVSTYRARHADFPAPAVDMGAGRCLLWLRQDIEAWASAHPGRRS
jgi:predicted DNA-binding transcriptional regulator AlpA